VIAISLGRKFLGTTILENNIIQTTGSAGESVAAGVVFTLPAFLFLSDGIGKGYFNYWTITILAIFGGILGVLMIISSFRDSMGEMRNRDKTVAVARTADDLSIKVVGIGSRIVGIIGSSNSPVSGMTIATITGTALVFIGVGWTGKVFEPMALVVGSMVCIAAANAGATSQDLKTGYLIGATPRY